MEKQIIWTPQAEKSFKQIIDYLEENWTKKEVLNFIKATEDTITYIAKNPKMFRQSFRENLFEAIVTKHNLLIFNIKDTTIDIITFWDTRQHPKKKSKQVSS
jgi:plasmid stabilization system protein ParE